MKWGMGNWDIIGEYGLNGENADMQRGFNGGGGVVVIF